MTDASEATNLALQEKQDLEAKLEWLKSNYTVIDDQSAYNADYLISVFAQKLEFFKAKEKPITSATYKAWQEALAIFREPKKFCEEIIAFLKSQIGTYTIQREQSRQQALQTAVATGNQVVAAELVDETELELEHTSTTTSYTFRIINPSLVPDRFCVKTVNTRLIELAVDEGAREIPGIEIYPRADVRRKGKRA